MLNRSDFAQVRDWLAKEYGLDCGACADPGELLRRLLELSQDHHPEATVHASMLSLTSGDRRRKPSAAPRRDGHESAAEIKRRAMSVSRRA
jgi:hypothetical protein